MSKDRQNIPQAALLMGSMRSMGYSFESAISDVIDNCISASCSVVKLLFPRTKLDPEAVGILDDGAGMDETSLFEAMRYGSNAPENLRNADDLGRFGLGMKTASMSQCRVLTVASKYEGEIHAFCWDYNYIQEKKDWLTKELEPQEIDHLPYINGLKENQQGTLVLWQDFDIIAKSSDNMVFDALDSLKDKVNEYVALIFHRYLSDKSQHGLTIYVNDGKVRAQDPFLESNLKTTSRKERSIAVKDSSGKEQLIKIKAFILPYASDLTDSDKRKLGGIETLRQKQGFYVYRNRRLIIWGTWFKMKPQGELTKNARIRVDIPNSLDDIWSIDVKKQHASIPRRIQQQLKNTVAEALDIAIKKQTHRGRVEKLDDDRDYIWNRMEGRNNKFYYEINRNSRLFQYVKDKMSNEDYDYLDLLIHEIEQNIPTQQMYIDRSNEAITYNEPDHRENEVYEEAITLIDTAKQINPRPVMDIIKDLMNSEPFCNYKQLADRLATYYEHGKN